MIKHEFAFWTELKRQKIQSAEALKELLRDDDYLQTQEGQKLMTALQKSLENYDTHLTEELIGYQIN